MCVVVALLVVAVFGLHTYHEDLTSEMDIIPGGESDAIWYDLSGKATVASNNQSSSLGGNAQLSLLFVENDRIYSEIDIYPMTPNGSSLSISSWNTWIWLDAKSLQPLGSQYLGEKIIEIDDKKSTCNVYEYIDDENGQKFIFYIDINSNIISKLECRAVMYGSLDSKIERIDIALDADLDTCNLMKGKYISGELGKSVTLKVNGQVITPERDQYGYEYRDHVESYSGNAKITLIADNQSQMNYYMSSSYKAYYDLTVELKNINNNEKETFNVYILSNSADCIRSYNQQEKEIGKTVIKYSTFQIAYGYIDENQNIHHVNYTIKTVYEGDSTDLKGIQIEGYDWYNELYTENHTRYTEIQFDFKSEGWNDEW
ncbi:hypothetical protein [Candidatus Methanomassiliicoccus intestinalis]|uniref:hypothetical protein n=1 Tax=Candidatus Methanomassiliicoccus intestinalis TaxID=1406512 RepID=UPI0037DC9F7A